MTTSCISDQRWIRRTAISLLVLTSLFLMTRRSVAEQIKVKYVQGTLHGFLVVRTQEGKQIGVGDFQQTVSGTRVTVKVELHMEDGSVFEDASVFSQRGVFRLVSDHVLEKGPAYKDPIEVWISCQTNQVKVLQMKEGKNKVTLTHLNLPGDLANGLVPILLQNITDNVEHTLPMVAATPKPRIVKLTVAPEGDDTFTVESAKYKAKRYLERVEIGGVAGAVAPLVGQKPPDGHAWILPGDAPLFLKSLGQLAAGTPVWEVELSRPMWSQPNE